MGVTAEPETAPITEESSPTKAGPATVYQKEKDVSYAGYGGTLMTRLTERVSTPPDEPRSELDLDTLAESSARVRAEIRNRGQGERGRGSGLRMQAPQKPRARPPRKLTSNLCRCLCFLGLC